MDGTRFRPCGTSMTGRGNGGRRNWKWGRIVWIRIGGNSRRDKRSFLVWLINKITREITNGRKLMDRNSGDVSTGDQNVWQLVVNVHRLFDFAADEASFGSLERRRATVRSIHETVMTDRRTWTTSEACILVERSSSRHRLQNIAKRPASHGKIEL